MNYGFVRVGVGIPLVKVADPQANVEEIMQLVLQSVNQGVEILLTPELSLTGYTCQDLFHQQMLIDEAEVALLKLMDFTRSMDTIIVVGLPVPFEGRLLNCAAVLQKGKLLGLVPKTFLPNYREFYEQRWFASAAEIPMGKVWLCGQQIQLSRYQLFRTPGCTFGIEICEDVWAPVPPSCALAQMGAELILNLSADNDCVGKYEYLKGLIAQQSARLISGYVFAGAGFGESTQDLVFGSKALVCENGVLLAEGQTHCLESQLVTADIDVERLRIERRANTTFAASAAGWRDCRPLVTDTDMLVQNLSELTRYINPHPFVPRGPELERRCEEIFSIQTEGLAKRLTHTRSKVVVVGISGGLDSTLALLVCVRTFDMLGLDRKGIVGITMPGFGTSDRTYTNAVNLMKFLGITIREISIKEACLQHFEDLGHDVSNHDVTYENGQARERTQILMDAANQMEGLVVGTGDLSELALGWATYNGDHMSMYGVNASVPKTLVKHLVSWVATTTADENTRVTLLDIVDTPISPELIPADDDGLISQKTEDLVGPYELHDFFLYYVLRWGFRPAKVFRLAQRAFQEQEDKTGETGHYDDATIKKWLTTFYRRFFNQQFKRSCLPDGPKVGSCSLSPRGDWRMPSDASSASWLRECEGL